MNTAASGRRIVRRIAGVIAGAALLAGCAPDGPDALPAEPLDRDAAIAAAIDVRVDGCGPRVGFGTGAVIGGGDVVTAAHVVAGRTAVEVIDVEGRTAAANVIMFDPDNDVALLRPDSPVGTPLSVRPADARADETGVVVLPRLTDGTVEIEVVDVRVLRTVNIATTDIYRERDVVRRGFEIEGSIDPGDSGTMVVLPGGGAGIVWARSNQTERRAWAIDLPATLRAGDTLPADAPPADVGACPP